MTHATTHVLLITCPDQKGLLHQVSGALFRRSLNIVENGEYVDRGAGMFFMRTQFTGGADPSELYAALASELPDSAHIELKSMAERPIVLLGTREPHCVGDLLLRQAGGELVGGKIVAVVSQYEDLRQLVERFDIPFHCIPAEGLEREEHDRRLIAAIDPYRPECLVLAKYMRVLSPVFVERYRGRILNIHHSFLPAFVGSKPYQQAYDRGVKIIGATAHFVNEELDQGPIIVQQVAPIHHSQDAAAMARAGRDIERVVLAKALRLILEDRVIVQGRRTLVFE